MGNSSSSSGTDGKNGELWKSKVFFDPIADEEGPLREISNDQLLSEMKRLIDDDETIDNISAFKCPLSSWQLTQLLLCHKFIVFDTNSWFWSIEKNDEGITVQRARKLDSVKNRYRRRRRNTPIELIKADAGRYTMKDLIEWIYNEEELYKEYSWIFENCKHFAKRLFDWFANTKIL